MEKELLNRIMFETGKRSGQPCIRGLRTTVFDVLGYLASGMTFEEILDDFPMLERDDILACLAFADARSRLKILIQKAEFGDEIEQVGQEILADWWAKNQHRFIPTEN